VLWDSSENWHARHIRSPERSSLSELGIAWSDVIHIVMLPTYKTPMSVLEETLDCLARSKLAKHQVGICLAFEERESEAPQKAAEIELQFKGRFKFIISTFHPSNLPGHVPGKSSNECWAFSCLRRDLEESHGIPPFDPRVVITVIDDDSDMHDKYFEALTHHFLALGEEERYLRFWQPPICQFKNYLRQPMLVRVSSLFATLHELACLANPLDHHVCFSSYSVSLVLASAVGGWDPEYLAEDWHMFAKSSLMTEGRVKCCPIFLPVLNYTPEEETYYGTLDSRWQQAKRHALGVSELVYVWSAIYLALLELPTLRRKVLFLWRIAPLVSKFTQTHFVNGMAAVWSVMAQLVIRVYMWGSWCHLHDLDNVDGACPLPMLSLASAALGGASALEAANEQILRNSLLVYWQQRATALAAISSILCGGLGAMYFHIVKDRVEGNPDSHWHIRCLPLMWLVIELECSTCGLVSSFIFGSLPLWIACIRVIHGVRFPHIVAGMVGRSAEEEL
ncbi:unnamed protein product, partial [Polarella glacialis]